MSKFEETANFVNFSLSYRMEPVVSNFTGKDDEAPWQQIEILCEAFWCLEIHRHTAFETQTCENFLEWGMGVDVGRNSMARHVVIEG